MYADADFARLVRDQVTPAHADPAGGGSCVACSHSHKHADRRARPAGAGEVDRDYVAWAARQAATAVILAWQQAPARPR